MAVAFATVFAVSGVAVTGTPALASDQRPAEGTVTRHDRSTLRPVSQAGSAVRRQMTATRDAFVQNNARRGALLDASQVALLTDPAARVIVASTDVEAIDGIDIGTVDGRVAGVGLRTHESGAAASGASVPVIGFAAGPSAVGFKQDKSGNHLVKSADDSDISSNFLQSWWWKFTLEESRESTYLTAAERSGSDFWIYARRGEAQAKASGHYLVDLTIRSRPWGGTRGNFKEMVDNAPSGTSTSCSDNGAIGVGFAQAGVTIPRTTCSSISGLGTVGDSAYEFGADWGGDTRNQIGIEALGSFKVKEGYVPSFADYIWATFDPGVFSSNKDVRWNDTGW
ncbi:hypothetical protein Ait01nite_070160 [Actinoplanes italicus]|nr:hypothetical protein Ait01nite_070160 [Actinoplanes italicus]